MAHPSTPWLSRRAWLRHGASLALGSAGLVSTGWLAGCATADGATSTPLDPALRSLLAPTGALRVGVYLGSPTSLVRNAQGQAAGLAWELGQRLATDLGAPFAPVELPRVADIVDAMASTSGGAQAPRVDFTFTNATPVRAQVVDFSEPLLSLELGYLVPATSTLMHADAIDQPGRRIGVAQGSTSQTTLPRLLRAASVVPVPTVTQAAEQMRRGELDAFATNKAILFEMSDTVAGSRVLPGRWGLEHLAIAIPKGRNAALPALQTWAQALRSSGELARMVQRAGLRGTAPA